MVSDILSMDFSHLPANDFGFPAFCNSCIELYFVIGRLETKCRSYLALLSFGLLFFIYVNRGLSVKCNSFFDRGQATAPSEVQTSL